MQVVVMPGGLVTGRRAEARDRPQSLTPFLGRPFIDWQLERFSACGVKSVVLCLAHLADDVEAHVQSGRHHGLTVRYSRNGEVPLGTGGALRRALPLLEPEFLLTFGGRYLLFDYERPLADLRNYPEAQGTMSVCTNENRPESGHAVLRGEWVTEYRKEPPGVALDHVDYGAVALRRLLLTEIENGAVFGVHALLAHLARRGLLRALPVKERGYDIDSLTDHAELTRHLQETYGDELRQESQARA